MTALVSRRSDLLRRVRRAVSSHEALAIARTGQAATLRCRKGSMRLTHTLSSSALRIDVLPTVAYMNNATLETLALFKGDTIICKGKKRKDTVLIVLTDENVEEGKIQMNKGQYLTSRIASQPSY